MHLKSFRQWIQSVYATQDEELDCDQLLSLIPQYVDLQVAGEVANLRFPDAQHHLDQCAECYDLYVTVRDAALLEHQQVGPRVTVE
jgi:predicted anti-sigma-YlaC factor YlaD